MLDRDTISNLWLKFEPLVRNTAKKVVNNVVLSGGTVTAHDLSGALHTGTLADGQAPQFLKTDGSRSLLGNLAVGSGITIDGVDIDQFKLAYDLHVANPDAHHAGFIGLTDASGAHATPNAGDRITLARGNGVTTSAAGSTVTIALTLASPSGLTIDGSQNLALADSVAGDGLVISGKVLAVGQGAGLTVSADAVALTTPGTLSASSSNSASGSHTHQVAASSAPGAAMHLLRTGTDGNLTLVDLDLTPAIETTPLTITSAGQQSAPYIRLTAPAATGYANGLALVSQVSGDAHPRLALHTNGMLGMGAGAARPDVFLSRSAAQTFLISGDGAGAEAGNLIAAGWGAFGDSVTPTAALDARSSTEQLRLRYDSTYYARFMVGGGGSLEVQPVGELILNPRGRTVRPLNPYETNLGSLQKKWLAVHAAELWVETLVAQETQATIGGRVLVGPTSVLDADLAAAATSLLSRYTLAAGDIVRLEADGKVEFMQVGAAVQNLARNASFEDWTGSLPNLWSKDTGATVSRVTAEPGVLPHGRNMARLSDGRLYQDVSGLTSGASYVATVRVRAAAGVSATLRLYNGGGFSSPTSASVTTTADWQTITVTRTAPAGGSLRIAVDVPGGTAVDVDAVLLEAGSMAGVFRLNTADAGGTYQYEVTRNLDGSGANDWYAGDAIFNTGQTGSGFIDLYSLTGLAAIPLTYIFNYANGGAPSPYEAGTYGPNRANDAVWELWGDGSGAAVGDAVYYGVAGSTFSALHLRFSQGLVNTGGSVSYEYWNGSAWATLTVSAYNALQTNGVYGVTFTPPGNWAQKTINGFSAYWVRLRWTVAATTLTTRPKTNTRASRNRRQYGPTMAMNVRGSLTYNDWAEHAALGNLHGLYDYGADVYGVAVGKYSPTTAWLSADETNGIRIMRGSATKGRWFADGTITIGEESPSQTNLRITSSTLALRINTTEYIKLDVSVPSVRVSDPGGASYVQLSGGDVQIWGNSTKRIALKANGDLLQGTNVDTAAGTLFLVKGTAGTAGEAGETLAAGDILIGRTASGKANVFYDESAGRVNFRGGTTVQAYVDTDGSIVAAGGDLRLSATGMTLVQGSTDTKKIRWLNGANTIASIFGLVSSGGAIIYTATSANTGGSVALHDFRAEATSQNITLNLRAQNSTGTASGLELTFNGTRVLTIYNDNAGLSSRHGFSAFLSGNAGAGIVRARDIQFQLDESGFTVGQSMIKANNNDWVRLADSIAWNQGVYIQTALRVDRHLFVGFKSTPSTFSTGNDGQLRVAYAICTTQTNSDPNYPVGMTSGPGGIYEAYRPLATTYIQSSGWSNTSCILFNAYISQQTALPSADNQTNYTVAAGAGNQRAGGIFFSSNGGVMRFMISPVSTGAGQFVDWDADGGAGPEAMNLSRYSGYLHASAWFYESDARSKRDISYPAEDTAELAQIRRKLRRLRPARARYTGDPTGRMTAGFIAQQIKEEFPEMVIEGESGYHAVATTELIPYLVADNAALEQELTDLRSRLDDLETLVRQLRPGAR